MSCSYCRRPDRAEGRFWRTGFALDVTERSTTSPDVLRAGWSIVASLVTVRPPRPDGDQTADHSRFGKILGSLEGNVLSHLPNAEAELGVYLDEMAAVIPDRLTFDEALAYWLNVYNAAALRLGARAVRTGTATVFGVPGAFTSEVVAVAGEELSLDQVEHGKVRRFRDPRIHSALVCGAISCPTLRREPYTGDVNGELERQMRRFLSEGALRVEPSDNRVVLSPLFAWFGRDFVRPHRMPTLLPARRRSVLTSLGMWLDGETAEWIERVRPSIAFSGYDWRLGCSIG
jgi:hypothetical protein